MRTRPVAVATTVIVLALALIGYLHAPVEGQTTPASGAAVSSEKGGQDVFGAYDVAPWPKPLTMLPGHEAWTWGAGQYVFAESPNRVFVLQRGELPVVAAAAAARSASADRAQHRVPDVPTAPARCDEREPPGRPLRAGRQDAG